MFHEFIWLICSTILTLLGDRMEILRAEQLDIPQILALVQECIQDMNANGITQWNDQYPPMEIFSNDLDDNSLFTLKDNNKLLGIIVISDIQDEEYKDIKWQDSAGKFIVVHRLAVHPSWQRQGLAEKMLDFAELYAKDNGFTSMRIDTFSKNPRTLRLFEKRNYERKPGEIHFPENSEPYYCYEKLL
jgi:ribosomal protein S18 acetylase RimI-like enzyme